MEANNYTIYIHQNRVNGKMYCGQTCQDPKKRFKGGSGYSDCPRFYNAIKKYGWDNFNHILLFEHLSDEMANIIETEIIKKYDLTNDEFGYNIDEGGAHSAPPIDDLTGQTFGRLTVIRRDIDRPGIYWLCRCSCDRNKIVSIYNGSLKSGATQSCGCIRSEHLKNQSHNLIHGMSDTPLYAQWRNMKKRLDAKDNIFEPWYDFKNFYSWAKESGYNDGDVIIRLDRNKMYSPDNCEWGKLSEYRHELVTSKTNLYEYNGDFYTINELAKFTDVPINALRQRLHNPSFKTIEDVLTTPYRNQQKIVNTYDFYQDYVVVNIPNYSFTVDYDVYEKIKNYIWIYNNNTIMERYRKGHSTIRLELFLFDVLPRHAHKIKLKFKNEDKSDFRKNNIEMLFPIEKTDYLFYISQIDEIGFVIENGAWRVGKVGDSRKTFHDISDALQYYDKRYGTCLYDKYINYLNLKETKAV